MNTSDELKSIFETLQDIYQQLDGLLAPLLEVHQERLVCKQGCCQCCVDKMTVSEVEALHIQHHYTDFLKEASPHAPGGCAFLDEAGSCRIYEHRPYVCRTQGLPLRWLEEREGGEVVELRDICPLNEAGVPIEAIPAEQCWPIGPVEEALAQLQERLRPGEMKRIALRSLFVVTDDM